MVFEYLNLQSYTVHLKHHTLKLPKLYTLHSNRDPKPTTLNPKL